MKNKITKILWKITTGFMHAFAASVIALFTIAPLDLFGVLSRLSDSEVQTLGFTLIGTVIGTLFGSLATGAIANGLDNSMRKEQIEKRGKELANSCSREQLMLKYKSCVQRYNLFAQKLDNIPILSIVAGKGKQGFILYDEETFQNYDVCAMEGLEEQLSVHHEMISENIVATPIKAFRKNGAYEALQYSTLEEFWSIKEEIECLEYAMLIQSATPSPAPRISVSSASSDKAEVLTVTDDPTESAGLMRLQ